MLPLPLTKSQSQNYPPSRFRLPDRSGSEATHRQETFVKQDLDDAVSGGTEAGRRDEKHRPSRFWACIRRGVLFTLQVLFSAILSSFIIMHEPQLCSSLPSMLSSSICIAEGQTTSLSLLTVTPLSTPLSTPVPTLVTIWPSPVTVEPAPVTVIVTVPVSSSLTYPRTCGAVPPMLTAAALQC